MVKEELSESVVEIRRSDRMMTMCLIFGEEMIRVICVYAPQNKKPDIQKHEFYDKLIHEWDTKDTKELTLGVEYCNVHVGKRWMDLRVYMAKMESESEIWKNAVGIL